MLAELVPDYRPNRKWLTTRYGVTKIAIAIIASYDLLNCEICEMLEFWLKVLHPLLIRYS
jgi:hypothetical protein